MTDRLGAARLELRALSPATAAALARGDRDAAAAILGVTLSPGWPQADLRDILPLLAAADPAAAASADGFGAWVIIERATTTIVGDAGFLGPPDAAGVVEIGYSIVPERRRLGYATEALTALLAWAFDRHVVRDVVARCDPDNVGSIRVLEATGFERSGEAEGQLTWRHRRP